LSVIISSPLKLLGFTPLLFAPLQWGEKERRRCTEEFTNLEDKHLLCSNQAQLSKIAESQKGIQKDLCSLHGTFG